MLDRVRLMLEMIRFGHTVFALPFALSSAALAWKSKPSFHWPTFLLEFVGILLCMVFARSAAMAFNRLADRDIDAANPRTAGRHLPAGKLTARAVWLFLATCAAGFIASTALFLLADPPNPWPSLLSVPVLLFVCG
jgi:4-hydroxybenzoate polyprenyltransferase